MQRLRSLRRSMSRSSRKSGGSPSSPSDSSRESHDISSPARSDNGSSTTDVRAFTISESSAAADPPSPSPAPRRARDEQPNTSPQSDTAEAPDTAESTGDAQSQPQDSIASLSTTITDPPILVEPPSPALPEVSAPVKTLAGTASGSVTGTGQEPLADSSVRHRLPTEPEKATEAPAAERKEEQRAKKTVEMSIQRPWLVLAVASGGFAALNGAFAKLTTASLTTNIATFLSSHLKIPVELANPVIRGFFFLLNVLSNAIMWALFTRALTAHSSATKVSLINTSANFLVTALLGALIFSEKLPAGWFGGAALLVLGTLIIGRDRQGEMASGTASYDADEEIDDEETPEEARPCRANGLGVEKRNGTATAAELQPLLAGDEAEGVKADGEDET